MTPSHTTSNSEQEDNPTLMGKEQELRPLACPFCGGKARLLEDNQHSTAWYVECSGDIDKSCAVAPSVWAETEAKAIAAWNRRSSSDEQAEVVAWLTETDVKRLKKLGTIDCRLYAEQTGSRWIVPAYASPSGVKAGVTEAHGDWRDAPCWEWPGSKVSGYGTINADGETQRAHRVVYEAVVGPIPDGLVLDHLCRNRCCVNPAHLEPVSFAENVLRGESPPAINARKTACDNGHEFTPENTRIYKGYRICRICARDTTRRRMKALRDRNRQESSDADH